MTFHQRQGIIVAALALLQGCGSSAPAIVTQTRTVEVPVSVPCRVPQIEAPAWALDRADPRPTCTRAGPRWWRSSSGGDTKADWRRWRLRAGSSFALRASLHIVVKKNPARQTG